MKKKEMLDIENVVESVQDISSDETMPEDRTPETAALSVKKKKGPSASTTLLYVLILFFVIGFAAFAFFSGRSKTFELILCGLSMLMFVWLAISIFPKSKQFFSGERILTTEDKAGERSRLRLHPTVRTILFALLAQVAFISIVYAVSVMRYGFGGTIIEEYPRLFVSSRALAFGDDSRSALSYFGLLSFILPENVNRLVAGSWLIHPVFALNTVFVCLAALFDYELLILDFDKKSSRFGTALLLVSPSIILMLQPMSGIAPFIALSLLSVFAARKGKLLAASLLAVLSMAFNIFGALLFSVILLEGIRAYRCLKDEGKKHKAAGSLVKGIVGAFIPAAAGAAAVLVSVKLGVGLPFLKNGFIWFFEPLSRLICGPSSGMTTGVLVISIIAIILVYLLAVFAIRRLRTSHAVLALLDLMLMPSLALGSMTLLSIFAQPMLTSMEASVLSRKLLRTFFSFAMAILTILFIVFFFTKRPA
ncbi:MAG: hypothetical protein IJM18_09670 [Clostridia bacterium]|nr:hypothetical protein [Clostridia bacterium]